MARKKKKVSHMKTKAADVKIHLRGKRLVLTIVIPRDMQEILVQRLGARLLGQRKSLQRTPASRPPLLASQAKIDFNQARAVSLYENGESLTSIAMAMGYPHGKGQTRVKGALMKAGVYKKKGTTE